MLVLFQLQEPVQLLNELKNFLSVHGIEKSLSRPFTGLYSGSKTDQRSNVLGYFQPSAGGGLATQPSGAPRATGNLSAVLRSRISIVSHAGG
jgi:hypothetical protein